MADTRALEQAHSSGSASCDLNVCVVLLLFLSLSLNRFHYLQLPFGKFTVDLKDMVQINAAGAKRAVCRGEV
jgi:hypothetical protein